MSRLVRPGLVRELSRQFPPTAFSFVMATGIVGTAAQLLDLSFVAGALFALNVPAYAVLSLMLLLRLIWHGREMRADLESHARGPGFLTLVAGTSVFGSQWISLVHAGRVALGLWIAAAIFWLGLIYALFARLTLAPRKPTIDEGLNGTWMLFIVSTQSIAVLGPLLVPEVQVNIPAVLGLSLCVHLLGCMFYILLISLIIYRFLFFSFDPTRLNPPYWINMGAVAITTLSGSLLISRAPHWPFLQQLLPFLQGFTLLFWSMATWWIPLLVILGVWRHGLRHVSLRYDIQYWSIVFPVGMYSVATYRLSNALHWAALVPWSRLVGYVAVAAWLLTTLGLCRALPSQLARPAP